MKGDRLDEVFFALADPTRRRVMRRLSERGPRTPTQLAEELPITRQAVSKHLSALSEAGLVSSRRSGREIVYQLTPGPLSDAVGWMNDVGGQWEERLEALRRHVTKRSAPRD